MNFGGRGGAIKISIKNILFWNKTEYLVKEAITSPKQWNKHIIEIKPIGIYQASKKLYKKIK